MDDSFWHKGLRKRLVIELQQQGITDAKVLALIEKVPRHFFIDTALVKLAYENRSLPILANQTISHPFTVAFQTQLLNLKENEKILEIGTGSGYQTAILAESKALVFSIERQKILFDSTRNNSYLKKYYNVKLFYGDGYNGLKTFAPFDKILITAAVPNMPQKLLAQLSIGGVIVMPQNVTEKEQQMIRLTKIDEQQFETERFGNFSFVPMLAGTNTK